MACALLSGCDELARLISDVANPKEAEAPSASEPATEEANADLPERPATSTARTETDVITFQSILEADQMTQAERIRAFENLDPAALQKPVVGSNVSAGSPMRGVARETRQAGPSDRAISAARQRVPVVMYSTDWCGVCRRARQYFEQNGISFVEHDVDRDPQALAEYVLLNPRRSVPTIKIGDEVIVGFSAQAVDRALDSAARKRLD